MSRRRAGRPCLFAGKDGSRRICVILTAHATAGFEYRREALARLSGIPPERLSDADVVEYLVRGTTDTRAYLRWAERRRHEGSTE